MDHPEDGFVEKRVHSPVVTTVVVSGFVAVIPSITKYFHEEVFDFYVPAS